MIWEPWEKRLLQEKALAPKNYSVNDLHELCRDNAIVNAHWKNWIDGHGGSFEQTLIRLVIDLATTNNRLFREMSKLSLAHVPQLKIFDTKPE